MAAIALVVHNDRPAAAKLARETAAWLADAGHAVRLTADDAEAADLHDLVGSDDGFGRGLDLVVSLGGDGTMLRAVSLVAADEVPIIGVNLGQLGYLTEVDPEQLREALEDFLAGRYSIEERMLLRVEVESRSGATAVVEATALNEAVVEKTGSGHTVRLDVEIDGEFFTPYATDGVIVATPTGSTAYSLSARGPIIEPTHRALLLTPVSPHMLFDRALVLGPESSVRLTVAGHRSASLSVDGRVLGELRTGDAVRCSASPSVARLVIFRPRDFHGILKAKFKLGDR